MNDASNWLAGIALFALTVLAIGWLVHAKALRVDRLHRQVLGARATLDAQLVYRAQAAAEVASTNSLDVASAHLLAQAAREALDCDRPLVEDGLDPAPEQSRPAIGNSSSARPRSVVESDLTRVIRLVLTPEMRAQMSADPVAQAALRRLDRAAYRLVLARSFHNTHVTEARRIRSDLDVRLLHLAGHAPMPAPADVDDDITAADFRLN